MNSYIDNNYISFAGNLAFSAILFLVIIHRVIKSVAGINRASLLGRLIYSQKGTTLIELVVALAIMGIVSGSLMTALGTGILGGSRVEDWSSASTIATAQMEDTLAQTYTEPPDYPVLDAPEGYIVTMDVYVVEPTVLQHITVTVSNSEETLIELEFDKHNENYVASPPTQLFAQRDFRWYENTDSTTPVTSLAEENTPYTVLSLNQIYRLRISVEIGQIALTAAEQDFKLQYSTNTSGPWTDVGAAGSGEIWRGYDNATPGDGATITTLLSTSDIAESYEEQNPSVDNPNAVAIGEWAEWDWVIEDNGAPIYTNFYFRMVLSDGTAFASYTRYPLLKMPSTYTFAQFDYRWYENTDSVTPTTSVASEHSPYTATENGLTYRLRMNVEVDGIDLDADTEAFKLQYATSTSGPWTDVGAAGSGEIWRGYDNATPADGATLPSTLLSTSDVPQSYEEGNPSIANPNALDIGEYGEWDWVIQDNGAVVITTYYFRMVEADGTELDAYTYYPQFTTAAQDIIQQDYRWYENKDAVDPDTPLKLENTPYSATAHGEVYRIRMNIEVEGADLPAGTQGFKLQYSTNTSGPWTDVGDSGSGEMWRGYDNATPDDGDAISVLLSTSDVGESYEEQNPSVDNLVTIDNNEKGEWDWVVENNGADYSTAFYFRMVESDGTALNTYTKYPQITTAPPPTITQEDYRWYANTDSVTPTVAFEVENDDYTSTAHGLVYRLRMNVEIDGIDIPAGIQVFKLQYSTNTSGPWTDVGAIGSGIIWRGYDNTTPDDEDPITSLLLTNSDVLESYEEQNPSAANLNALDVGERGEWDWVIQDNGAADNMTYFFRMVRDDDTALNDYTRYPQLTTPPPQTLTQQDYRWYENKDSTTPDSALANENTDYSGATPLTVYRLRMNMGVGGAALPEDSQAFKLQYATSTSGPWTDVGVAGSGEIWRGYDNTTPADGDPISTILLSSDVLESYEEQNPSVANLIDIPAGDEGEWDWVVQYYATLPTDVYYFRMVKSNGTVLTSYINYPQIETADIAFTQQDYHWYANADSTTPGGSLTSDVENTRYDGATPTTVYRLRMNVGLSGTALPADMQQFKLQYSTDYTDDESWVDVGDIDSGEIWRGYDNTTPGDGDLISILLSSSDVAESYEEQNPSVAGLNAIPAGQEGEWDWVIQNYGVPGDTIYYFRMVKSDDTALNTYSNYPEIETAPLNYNQQDYRWYANVNGTDPTEPDALEDENTDYTATVHGEVYRIRMNLQVLYSNLLADSQSFKLQYSTNTSGPWTDVGDAGSGEIWRGYDNATPGDGDPITSLLLTNSDVLESYEEQNPSVANLNQILMDQYGEWDWVIEDNGAADSTVYYFRMTISDGTALDTYTRYPQLTTPPPPTLTQQEYHWYANADSVTPGSSLAAENTAYTSTAHDLVYRIRMNLQVTDANLLAEDKIFKLQYATNQSGPWTDVGAAGSGVIWRGYDNATPADGASIAGSLLTNSDILETYEEQNPSAANPNAFAENQYGEWDWVIEDNGAADSTLYYFRMVESDNTALDAYTRYPQLTTPPPQTLTQQEFHWYENADSTTPGASLTSGVENTAYTEAETNTVYRLRMNIEVGGADMLTGTETFKLQYSTSTSGPWTDVGAAGSGVIWRGYDNATPSDGASISTLLSTSNVAESYEEQNPSVVNPNDADVGQYAEWDWVLEDNYAVPETTYFFRMVKSDGTVLDTYTRYPKITTIWPVIAWDNFESGGWSGGDGWSAGWWNEGDSNIEWRDYPYEGTYHLRMRRVAYVDRSADITGRTTVLLRFQAKARSFENGDYTYCYVSSNGTDWGLLQTWVNGGGGPGTDDDTYHFYEFDVSSYISSTFWIAFESDMDRTNDYFYVDDLKIVGQ